MCVWACVYYCVVFAKILFIQKLCKALSRQHGGSTVQKSTSSHELKLLFSALCSGKEMNTVT